MNSSPVTSVSVMIPSGRTITLTRDLNNKRLIVAGLQIGSTNIEAEEAFALKDLLNVMFV